MFNLKILNMKLKFKNGGTIKLQSGGKTYKHNDYYGYINKIQENAISNPQWFWSDASDASEARQWLYNNGAGSVVDNIYDNTPEDIQKTIDYKKLSTNSGTKKITSDIHSAQKNFMDTAGAVGLQSMAPVGLAVGLTVAPEVTIPALIGGVGGMKATDYAINKLSNDTYNTWGEFIRGGKDLGQTGNLLAEFTNPGGWIGGGMTGALVRRSTPMMIRSMQDRVYELNGDGKFIYDIPGGSKARLNATEPVKWKPGKSKDAAYNDGTIQVPLFARKSQIAHELGHHAAGQGDQILGAYTEGYQYAPNSSWETERAENFADLFKTKLGYRYKGKNANLKARQDAIDSGKSEVFDKLVNPGNHREFIRGELDGFFKKISNPDNDEYGILAYLDELRAPYNKMTNRQGPVRLNVVGEGVPQYKFEIQEHRPVNEYFGDIARELNKVFGSKVDFSDVSSLEKIARIQKVIEEHPFVRKFKDVNIKDQTSYHEPGDPAITLPFDVESMFWENPSGPTMGEQLRTLLNNIPRNGRITEINTSADSEPIKLFLADMYPEKVNITRAKTFSPIDGSLINSSSTGNTMHRSKLIYDSNDGSYRWGNKLEKTFKAPLDEASYEIAKQKYAKDLLRRWNYHIDNINAKRWMNIEHARLDDFPSFDRFDRTKFAKPSIIRPDVILTFKKNGGTIKSGQ